MARNEEKQLGRLNRLHLQKFHKEEKLRNPTRPKLVTLNSTDEISKWLPSIKKDIDFFLKQSQVTCYTETKIREFEDEITRLRKEYMAFVRKIWELQLGGRVTPWVQRKYLKRHKEGDEKTDRLTSEVGGGCDDIDGSGVSQIHLPVLHNDAEFKSLYGYQTNTHPAELSTSSNDGKDTPLEFQPLENRIHGVHSLDNHVDIIHGCRPRHVGHSSMTELYESRHSVNPCGERHCLYSTRETTHSVRGTDAPGADGGHGERVDLEPARPGALSNTVAVCPVNLVCEEYGGFSDCDSS